MNTLLPPPSTGTSSPAPSKKSGYLKIAAICLGGIVGLIAIVIVVGVSFLPSPALLKPKTQAAKPDAADSVATAQASAVRTAETDAPTDAELDEEDAKTAEALKSFGVKRVPYETIFPALTSLLDENPADIRICDKLGKKFAAPKFDHAADDKEAEFGNFMRTMFPGDIAELSPELEAIHIPMRAMMQEPELARELRDLNDFVRKESAEDLDGLWGKLRFYQKAAGAAASAKVFEAHKGRYELLFDRAFHLIAISKLANRHPELAGDPRVRELCAAMENADPELDRAKLADERRALVALLESHDVAPKSVGLDTEKWFSFDEARSRARPKQAE